MSEPVSIRPIGVAEAFVTPGFNALCREYAAESALAGLPDPQEKLSAYQALEAGGSSAFCAYGAFLGERLIGFVALLTPILPHYGVAVAVAESLFVGGEYRKSGAGMLLIRRAEKRAKEMRSPGLLFSAPSGGRLALLLPRIGYRETNRVFLKGFSPSQMPAGPPSWRTRPVGPERCVDAEAAGAKLRLAPSGEGSDKIPALTGPHPAGQVAPGPGTAAGGTTAHLPTMGQNEVDAVRRLEQAALALPQVPIPTDHVFHAGMYARTIKIPAGVALTGAEIKIATILIISGDVLIYGEKGPVRYAGYHVALGQAGRKQAFYALQDTYLTMLFPTGATTVDAAEREFTDEYEKLFSRKEGA